VRLAVVTRLGWIRRQQVGFRQQVRQSLREMVTGETHYVQGRRYRLNVIEADDGSSVRLRPNGRLEMRVRPKSGRSLRHLVDALAELKAVGCAFVSLRDNLDLTTPAGRMMFHVIGAMAEFERELIRERVKAGLVHARSKGQKLGRPKVRRDRDQDAKVIRRMRAEGDSYGEIAEALGRTKSDIYRVCMTLGCQRDGASTASPMSVT
jgi:hypothetical protein